METNIHIAQNAHMPTLWPPPEVDLNQFDCGGGLWRRESEEKKGTEILKMRRERGRMINSLFMLCAGSDSFDQKKGS